MFEDPTPIDPTQLKAISTAPQTLTTFFKPKMPGAEVAQPHHETARPKSIGTKRVLGSVATKTAKRKRPTKTKMKVKMKMARETKPMNAAALATFGFSHNKGAAAEVRQPERCDRAGIDGAEARPVSLVSTDEEEEEVIEAEGEGERHDDSDDDDFI